MSPRHSLTARIKRLATSTVPCQTASTSSLNGGLQLPGGRQAWKFGIILGRVVVGQYFPIR